MSEVNGVTRADAHGRNLKASQLPLRLESYMNKYVFVCFCVSVSLSQSASHCVTLCCARPLYVCV